MALTSAQQAAVTALLTQEGSTQSLVQEIQALAISNQKAADLTALAGCVTVTVNDWAAISTFLSTSSSITMYSIISDMEAALAAQNATNVGMLAIALFGAVKANFNI